MGKLMAATAKNPPVIGDLIEGPVIALDKAAVYVDLAPFGTGIIYGREYIIARDVIKKINVGDVIAAKIVDNSHKEGYYELSLKEARQALIWSEAEARHQGEAASSICRQRSQQGRLAHRMARHHRIPAGFPAQSRALSARRRRRQGQDPRGTEEAGRYAPSASRSSPPTRKEGKLIFSEKGSEHKEKEKIVSKYEIGDEVEGVATGVVDFGVFVKLEEGLEGLIHISEIDWGLVDDPRNFVKVGRRSRPRSSRSRTARSPSP